MARARNIKPAFFTNDDLVQLPMQDRMLFIGLWTLADREGRLEDRPMRIKMQVFPADDINVDESLTRLASTGMLIRYEVDGGRYIEIVNFTKHQRPHVKEAASEIPPYTGENEPTPTRDSASTIPGSGEHALIPDTGYLNEDTGYLNADSDESAAREQKPTRFTEFWQAYPKKVGKGAAAKAFKAIKWREIEFPALMSALEKQKQSAQWQDEGGRFIPNPATWLNQERWGDELPTERGSQSRISPKSNQATELIERAKRERAEYEQARSNRSDGSSEHSMAEGGHLGGTDSGLFLVPGRRTG